MSAGRNRNSRIREQMQGIVAPPKPTSAREIIKELSEALSNAMSLVNVFTREGDLTADEVRAGAKQAQDRAAFVLDSIQTHEPAFEFDPGALWKESVEAAMAKFDTKVEDFGIQLENLEQLYTWYRLMNERLERLERKTP